MTLNRIVLPDVPDDDSDTLNRLLEQLDAKKSRNLLRASYYDGKHAMRQLGTVIPPQYYQVAAVLGWTPKGVDFLARRCNLDTFVWPDGDLDGLGFGEVADANHLSSEVSSAIISSLIHGVSFLVNTRGDERAGEPAGLIHVKDATAATGEWNPRTRRLDNLLSITGRAEDGEPTSLALYLDGVTITAIKDGPRWESDRSEHPWGVPAEPLVYKPRAGRPFGMSRISRPAMALQDMAVRTIIRMEANADIYSFPQMILLGADSGVFMNKDGSMKSAWQVALGRVFALPDDDDQANPRVDVKQFSASSPQPHADQLEVHAGLFAGEMDLPVTALGVQAKTNTTTADGSDNAERQLVAEAEGATDDWSPSLERALRRALAMQQGLTEVPTSWRTIQSKWRSPIYLSRAAEADAGSKQIGAVPWLAETEVGLELLGLDPQQIKRAMADRRRSGGSAALRAVTQAAQASGAIPAPADLLAPGVTPDGLDR